MQITPYILLSDKKTAVHNPTRQYELSEVYGIVFSDITGEHIRVMNCKETKDIRLLQPKVNFNDIHKMIAIDAIFDFDGKENTKQFENLGSPAVKYIKENFGNEWFIPSAGEYVSMLHCRKEIQNLLKYINDSIDFCALTHRWTSSRYDKKYAYYYSSYGCTFDYCSFSDDIEVLPITLIESDIVHNENDKNDTSNTSCITSKTAKLNLI